MLVLCCSKDVYILYVFYWQVSQMDQDSVRVTSLQVLFDLLQTYGLDAFQVEQDADTSGATDTSKTKDDSTVLDDSGALDFDTTNSKPLEQDAEATPPAHAGSSLLTIFSTLLDSEVGGNYIS